MSCKINPYVDRWIEMVEGGEIKACEEQHLLVAYIKKCFKAEEIYVDELLLDKYLGLARFFPFEKLFEWQEFCVALHLCTFLKEDNTPRWTDLLLLIGRGAGKDGFIAFESFCLISPNHDIKNYDIDICANAEEQAMRPLNDLLNILEDTTNYSQLKRFFYWTKQHITGLRNRGVIKGRTNSPKSKDGMRSGMVVFNEIHQYENYDNIKVFVTGQGKVPHPRRLYASSNGDVREGPLDDLMEQSKQILNGVISDNGMLPFVCRIDNKDEAKEKENWVKANPSIIHLPALRSTIEKEFVDWKNNPTANADFMTKRMNLPQTKSEVAVTDYENITATNQPMPDLSGCTCVCGIDYASINDLASVNLRIKKDGFKYDINHSWLCLHSKDLHRIKAPWREWAEQGLITLVDDVQISPALITDWIAKQAEKYFVEKIAIDDFRYSLMREALQQIGFTHEEKNLIKIRPSDIMRIVPVIESDFTEKKLVWGDNPVLRWAANNAKVMTSSRRTGSDTGNRYYAKIEGKSRKTDPFMAMVAAATQDSVLEEINTFEFTPAIIP